MLFIPPFLVWQIEVVQKACVEQEEPVLLARVLPALSRALQRTMAQTAVNVDSLLVLLVRLRNLSDGAETVGCKTMDQSGDKGTATRLSRWTPLTCTAAFAIYWPPTALNVCLVQLCRLSCAFISPSRRKHCTTLKGVCMLSFIHFWQSEPPLSQLSQLPAWLPVPCCRRLLHSNHRPLSCTTQTWTGPPGGKGLRACYSLGCLVSTCCITMTHPVHLCHRSGQTASSAVAASIEGGSLDLLFVLRGMLFGRQYADADVATHTMQFLKAREGHSADVASPPATPGTSLVRDAPGWMSMLSVPTQ